MQPADKLDLVLNLLRNLDAASTETTDPILAAELRGAGRLRRRLIDLLESDDPISLLFREVSRDS
jgi:hypothetical protein